MKALYRFFESVQLAIVLFLLIAVFSILSTLVPQGKTQEFYTGLYGSATALLIAGSGLSLYNQSLLFRRKRLCRFTVAKVEYIDYKEIDVLRDFIGENGKIFGAISRKALLEHLKAQFAKDAAWHSKLAILQIKTVSSGDVSTAEGDDIRQAGAYEAKLALGRDGCWPGYDAIFYESNAKKGYSG
jgi:hypothetical protein